ncbi:MAG TPA: GNAT family N-acetyltransferase [Candidatus Sulfotelmatobacter sp.]|nr:GNAT family N-acetyltransferase [Candidatus Sulfotelmatobacter sp.]
MPLENGWVFCRIRSWLTGRRLVSLPFSDHCDPLVESPDELLEISRGLATEREKNRWRYIECRFLSDQLAPENFERSEEFCFHRLDLQPSLDELFRGLHKNSTQRKIRRAEREGLTYEEGSSEEILDEFYRLLLRTRKRHRVPPQPRRWFSNLLKCFGSQLKVRAAKNNGTPVASIVTLRFKDTLVYKYGAADERFFSLGGMQFLLWQAIIEAKNEGLQQVDFGRSDLEARGLNIFKDRLGAKRSSLSYFRNPPPSAGKPPSARLPRHHRVLSHVPYSLVATTGRLLYRHFG